VKPGRMAATSITGEFSQVAITQRKAVSARHLGVWVKIGGGAGKEEEPIYGRHFRHVFICRFRLNCRRQQVSARTPEMIPGKEKEGGVQDLPRNWSGRK
jgi:hypothetical protein